MRLLFLGDVSLYRIDDSFSFADDWAQLCKQYDYVIANLEGPITESSDKKSKQVYCLSSSTSSISMLSFVDVVSLANNHILDYNDQGVNDTKTALSNANIGFFGVGHNGKEALAPYIINDSDTPVALIGASRYANAKKKHYGTASDSNLALFKQIRKLKGEGYFVIVYFHWGYEYVRIPSPRERIIARKCINNGADFVVGSHPHVCQGVEQYRGKTIAYSLGNFIFHSSVFDELSPLQDNSPLYNSFALGLSLEGNLGRVEECYAYEFDDEGIRLLSKDANEKFIKMVETMSKPLKKFDSSYLSQYFRQCFDISQQNVKVRKKYQINKNMNIWDRLSLYKDANFQDVINRLAGLYIKWTKNIK